MDRSYEEKQALDWNPQEAEGEEGWSKPGTWPFCRKQENAAKHGAKLRYWREVGSDGDAAQMPHIPNGTKGYTIAMLATMTWVCR